MSRTAALRRHWAWWVGMSIVVVGVFVFAGRTTPEEGTGDDRLFGIAEQLKCLQCVGESVAASQSPLAQQFREEIDEQMAAGRTDDEILAYFADSYGDEVLLDPPAGGVGALAWLLPVLVAGGAVIGLGFAFSRWRSTAATAPGPRIDEVVTVGARPAGAGAVSTDGSGGGTGAAGGATHDDGSGEEAAAGTSESAAGTTEASRAGGGLRWKPLAIFGGLAAFAVLATVLLLGGSGERGDGEITGGTGGAATASSGIAECQPLAMSDPEAGIECYDELLDADPGDAEALTYRGWAKVRAGQLEEGRADLAAALEAAPGYADPHVFLAIAAVQEGDFGEAASEMESFWAADPSDVAVSVVQSEGLERQVFFGLMSAPARDCWQSAAQAAPDGSIDQAFLDALGGCLVAVLAADPSDPDARLSLALASLGPEESDAVAARTLLEGLLEQDPEDSDALALLVSVDISEGDLDAAEAGLDRLAELPRGAAAFLIGDADALAEALSAAREATLPNPDGG